MKKNKFYCGRFYVTHLCNSKCVFCDTNRKEEYKHIKPLELEDAKLLILQMYQAGIRYMDFTGGEPTLEEKLPELLLYAKSLGIKTEVTTNAVMGMTEILYACAKQADKFNISIDTLDSEKYLAIRGIRGLENVKRTVEPVRVLREKNGLAPPKLMTAVSEDNLDEIDKLIAFAQEKQVDIYFNPVFSYTADMKKNNTFACAELLKNKAFKKNTVIMLHFLEFYLDLTQGKQSRCSANQYTLTVAADGSLMVPCYHFSGRKRLLWKRNLEEILEQEEFQYYKIHSGNLPECESCMVTPYFGISFNYRLDKYFLLQSFSTKLEHLKRDYLNHLPVLAKEEELNRQFTELLEMIRSLELKHCINENSLYWSEKKGDLFETDVYRKPITAEQYFADLEAEDCWSLKHVPHAFFDGVCHFVYKEIYRFIRFEREEKELLDIFRDSEEFMLRWWKLYITRYMNVSIKCAIEEEEKWLNQYFDNIDSVCKKLQIPINWFQEYSRKADG